MPLNLADQELQSLIGVSMKMDSAIETGLSRTAARSQQDTLSTHRIPQERNVSVMPSQYSSNQKLDATSNINWVTTFFMVAFHLGAVAALFFFSWKALFVAICATLTLEGGPIFWVATHRIHHQFTDQEGDPHSPRDGKWWSHMGWILTGKSMHHDTTTLARYVPDLAKDKFHVWITKYHYVPMVVLGLILLAVSGWPLVLWGIFLRTVVGLHATWLVNSATHSWGTRRFKTRDLSTNSWWVAILSWGEGWHNNHHAHPVSARHGLRWYEIDFNWYGIWILKQFGLVSHIHRAEFSAAKL